LLSSFLFVASLKNRLPHPRVFHRRGQRRYHRPVPAVAANPAAEQLCRNTRQVFISGVCLCPRLRARSFGACQLSPLKTYCY